jgi:hypothetical protein
MSLLFGSMAYYHQYRSGKTTNLFTAFKNANLNKNINIISRVANLMFITASLCIGTMGVRYSFLPSNIEYFGLLPTTKLKKTSDGTKAWNILGCSEKAQKATGFAAWAIELVVIVFIIKKYFSEIIASVKK